MSSTSQAVPPSRLETRAKNKLIHPGNTVKAKPRRTSAEVQQEREAKAKAKLDREKVKQKSIVRTAEFERTDMANEDSVDATPRPPFTPKPWPPPRNNKRTKLRVIPITDSSDADMDDTKFDKASFSPLAAQAQAPTGTEESAVESAEVTDIESDDPAPPAKKQKVHSTVKATGIAGASTKAAENLKKRKVGKDEKIVPTPSESGDEADEETPKPKKIKVRDEIKLAAENINKEIGSKYSGMVKSMSSDSDKQGEMPAPKAPLQLQAEGEERKGKKLKREGAIADISALYKKVSPANPEMSSKHQNEVMDIDNRYISLPYSHVSITNR